MARNTKATPEEVREAARVKRANGKSTDRIAKELGIPRATAYDLVQGVAYEPEMNWRKCKWCGDDFLQEGNAEHRHFCDRGNRTCKTAYFRWTQLQRTSGPARAAEYRSSWLMRNGKDVDNDQGPFNPFDA